MKKIKVNNAQVLTIMEGFNRMRADDITLPAMLTYKLVKNIRAIESTHNAITETKNLLINKHQSSEEGLKQGTKEFEAFLEEFAPVLEETSEFEIDMLTVDMFEGLEFSMADMLALEFMIED